MTPGSKTPTERAVGRLADKLPALIQQDITVFCPNDDAGNVYAARVLAVDDLHLTISLPRRVAGQGYLRSSTPVVVNFIVGRSLYEVSGQYRADDDRSRELILSEDIVETNRRRFERRPITIQTGYVPISDLRLARGQLANLRWKQAITLDISAGGILLRIPFQPPSDAYFLLNLEVSSFDGPLFVFGQVRWFTLSDAGNKTYLCGIRFIPREELSRHFSRRAISELPSIMLPFDLRKQRELDEYLKTHIRPRRQGVCNDHD